MRIDVSRSFLTAALAVSTLAVPALGAPARSGSAHTADALHARLVARLDRADMRLTAARKTGRVAPARAAELHRQLAAIRTDAARYTKQQGFLSAGESASYNRMLDTVDARLRR